MILACPNMLRVQYQGSFGFIGWPVQPKRPFTTASFVFTSADTAVSCIICEAPTPAKGKAKVPAKGPSKGPPAACRTLLSLELSFAPFGLGLGERQPSQLKIVNTSL